MKLNFLIHASPSFESRYQILKTSIEKYEPDATITRIVVDNPIGKYVNGLAKKRFEDVLAMFNMGHDNVVVLGADCEIFKELKEIKHVLNPVIQRDVIICPHVVSPCQDIHKYYPAGIINADIMAFRNTSNTQKILNWLLTQDMSYDPNNGKFYEQTYLTFLPFIFPYIYILKDDTHNVAWYNVHERDIKHKDGKYLVNENPLSIFHYTGYEKGNPEKISKHSGIKATGDLLKLMQEYDSKI